VPHRRQVALLFHQGCPHGRGFRGGRAPPYSVVVSGTMPGKPRPDGSPGPSLYRAVIVKTVDKRTRAKTPINELIRRLGR
jgi:tetrahydrodipicolinate N-succinyltransferase